MSEQTERCPTCGALPEMVETRKQMQALAHSLLIWTGLGAVVGVMVFSVRVGYVVGGPIGAGAAGAVGAVFAFYLIRLQLLLRRVLDPTQKWIDREAELRERVERAEEEKARVEAERVARDIADLERGLR